MTKEEAPERPLGPRGCVAPFWVRPRWLCISLAASPCCATLSFTAANRLGPLLLSSVFQFTSHARELTGRYSWPVGCRSDFPPGQQPKKRLRSRQKSQLWTAADRTPRPGMTEEERA